MPDLKFTVTIRDYESGTEGKQISATDIEEAVQDVLDNDASDGMVIVVRSAV